MYIESYIESRILFEYRIARGSSGHRDLMELVQSEATCSRQQCWLQFPGCFW